MYFKPLLLTPSPFQSTIVQATLFLFMDNIYNKLEYINYLLLLLLFNPLTAFALSILGLLPLFSILGSNCSNNKFDHIDFYLKFFNDFELSLGKRLRSLILPTSPV